MSKVGDIFLLLFLPFAFAFQDGGGFPNVSPTQGQIWPQPQLVKNGNGEAFMLDPNNFRFQVKTTFFSRKNETEN